MGTAATRSKPKEIQRRTPRQQRAQATRDLVLETAARIIAAQGPGALTTNRIAERAGISIGTLYGYFADKRAILVALARQMLEQDRAAIAAAMADPGEDMIAALIRALLARHSRDKALRRAVMAAHHAEGHGAEHAQSVEWFLAAIAQQAGFAHVSPVRRMIAVQAALGIARAVTDGSHDEADIPLAELEAETTALVRLALGGAGAAQNSASS